MASWNKRTTYDNDTISSGKYTAGELARLLGRDLCTIYNWASELGVTLKKPDHNRIYSVNEDFFDTWTLESSYVLGFIAADGYVCLGPRNGGLLSIGLAKKDLGHLENIRSMMESSHPIREKKTNFGTMAVKIDIGSRKIINRLHELGIVQKKSNILVWPDIPKEFVSHFVRGYFDGDGYIRLTKTKYGINLEMSMLGTLDFLQGIKDSFGDMGSIKSAKSQYKLSYGGTDLPARFGSWLYRDSSDLTRLNRKYDIYIDFLDNHYVENHYGSREWKDNISVSNYKVTNRDQVIQMTNRYLRVGSYTVVAKEFGIKYPTARHNIQMQLKRMG